MRAILLALALLPPLPAFAACPGDTILSCRIGRKALDICHSAGTLSYRYGTAQTAELVLSTATATADYTPWPGFSRSIWSSLAFHNDGVTYEVWHSFDRMDPQAIWEAGINVLQGDKTLAQLTCDQGSVRGDLAQVFELKQATGQCWNHERFAWQAGPCP